MKATGTINWICSVSVSVGARLVVTVDVEVDVVTGAGERDVDLIFRVVDVGIDAAVEVFVFLVFVVVG